MSLKNRNSRIQILQESYETAYLASIPLTEAEAFCPSGFLPWSLLPTVIGMQSTRGENKLSKIILFILQYALEKSSLLLLPLDI